MRRVRDLTTAWRRYRHVRGHRQEYADPGISELEAAFGPLLHAVSDDIQSAAYIALDGTTPPWTATDVAVQAGQEVSVFAIGRL